MNIVAIAVAVALTFAPVPMDCDTWEVPLEDYWDGAQLNSVNGVVTGPSGKETYYNLDMCGVVEIMRNAGYTEEEYPYWVREDGVKMLGPYVMCAGDFQVRPLGTIVDTTLGKAIVCDTGTFTYEDPYQLDIAVEW